MVKICSTNKGYIHWDGKIQFIDIESMVCEKDKGLTLICNLGGVHQQILLTEDDSVPVIYPTEDDCAYKENGHKPVDFAIRNISNFKGDYNGNLYYISKDGVKYQDWDYIKSARYTPICYTRADNTATDLFKHWSVEILDESIYYASEEIAEACMDVEVVENDGSTHMRKSLVSCISLTDEQKVLWENLKNALKSCKDANIQLFFDMDADLLYAVNRHEDIDLASYAEECDGYTKLSSLVESEVLNAYSFCCEDCDTGVFAKFKN